LAFCPHQHALCYTEGQAQSSEGILQFFGIGLSMNPSSLGHLLLAVRIEVGDLGHRLFVLDPRLCQPSLGIVNQGLRELSRLFFKPLSAATVRYPVQHPRKRRQQFRMQLSPSLGGLARDIDLDETFSRFGATHS
jgi:hypothetical protein